MVGEDGRAPELGPFGRERLPERPRPAVGLALEIRGEFMDPRLDASVIEPGVTRS
jgi:hypothetical protein